MIHENSSDISAGNTWIVVANAAGADIFKRAKKFGPLTSIAHLVEPDGRARDGELTSDQPGRSFDSQGQGRHAMEAPSASTHVRESFARRIAERLNKAVAGGKCQSLVLIAAPEMLGMLRTSLSKSTSRAVAKEISRNVTGADAAAIAALLEAERE